MDQPADQPEGELNTASILAMLPKWLALPAKPGTHNLQLYLRGAILPELQLGEKAGASPLPNCKSNKNSLSVRPEMWRKLKAMEKLDPGFFDEDASLFTQSCMPSHDLEVDEPDGVRGEELTVPHPTYFTVRHKLLCHALDVEKLRRWVEQYPLATVQRAMHAAFPGTVHWSFKPSDLPEADGAIVSWLTWDTRNEHFVPTHTALAVMVQPPWIVSAADLIAFSNCRRLRHPRDFRHNAEYRSQERMWAKLWDFCCRKQCRWFVVTTYSGWVFGAFSAGRTKGFVSPVKAYDCQSPSLLEVLTFWLVSAMHMPGGTALPAVLEPVSAVAEEPNFTIPPAPSTRFSTSTPSETEWSQYDVGDDEMDREEMEEVAQMLVSGEGVNQMRLAPPQLPPPQTVQQMVMAWQQPPFDDTVSEASSEAFTVSSATTTMTGALMLDPTGDLLASTLFRGILR